MMKFGGVWLGQVGFGVVGYGMVRCGKVWYQLMMLKAIPEIEAIRKGQIKALKGKEITQFLRTLDPDFTRQLKASLDDIEHGRVMALDDWAKRKGLI